jgi:hypothetical protein
MRKVIIVAALAFLQCSTGNTDAVQQTTNETGNNSITITSTQSDSTFLKAPLSSKTDSIASKTIANIPVQKEDSSLLDLLLRFDSDSAIIEHYGNEIMHQLEYSSEVEGSWPVTVLFPGTKDAVQFEWRDMEKFKGLQKIYIHGEHSRWKTKSGVVLGTTLEELERLNENPFLFYYLGWNFEGEVQWNGGKLENMKTYVTVGPNGSVDPRLYYPLAPELISSDSEAAKNSHLIVQAITIWNN